MGSFLSSAGNKHEDSEVSRTDTCKRRRMTSGFYEKNSRIIPGLPDEVSLQILARVPRIRYFNVRLVSRKWKATVTNAELFKVRKKLKATEEWLYILTKNEDDKYFWHALDPLSRKWQRLPPMPNVAHEEESQKSSSGLWMWNMIGPNNKILDIIKVWFGRKSVSDEMPFCGCSIGALEGCLYVLGGFSRASTVKCVWKYDPMLNVWSEVASMSIGRAYCKTAILNNKLYVVGGVTQGRAGLAPLESAEAFDPHRGTWSILPSMPFSRAQVLPTGLLADMLKPMATGMTSYRGRLCVPQSLYSWPFFIDVGGEVYNPETNSWVEMPAGMGEGWPAKQAGTKLSAVVEDELYAIDPASTLDSCKIKVYDQKEDAWKIVTGKVPIYDFTNSDSPYLLAGFLRKLHVITKDTKQDIVVLQADAFDTFRSAPSTSPSFSMEDFFIEQSPSLAESGRVVWKVIAARDFGLTELVGCQVLHI